MRDFVMLPLRVVDDANATLAFDACHVRDIAVLISRVARTPIDDLERFDAAVKLLTKKWIGSLADN